MRAPGPGLAALVGARADRETAVAILAHARDHLAPYLRVRRLEFAELPKTISGKIHTVELRARERDDAAAVAATEWRYEDLPELGDGPPRR
ncbi:hypothetical protein [Pseudonocardia sp. TMWB2A]|uniref:hypothetical protein n=1 Tax=Pseudonocardia sp. TMWB2A TaxID=687430 RepID=UPI003FD5BAA3